MRRSFLNDAADLVSLGTRSINADSFTKCFSPISALEMHHSGVLYIFSILIRYLLLFPLRFTFFIAGTLVFAFFFLVGVIFKSDRIIAFSFWLYCNVFCMSFGARIRNHGNKKWLNVPHVYVANHTSFLDFIVLSSHKFCHASLAENHGGLFGFFFKNLLLRNGSLYFKRCEKNDKSIVKERIKQHIQSMKTPMLIFPEGTCVNNKYTVMFQKSVFEIDATICPVAIKYKRTLFDPYWNRRRHTFTEHLLYLMSRWCIDVDVYWMDPVNRGKKESVFDFMNRVKTAISAKGGLVSLKWNGYMKNRIIVKDIEILRAAFRQTYLDVIGERAHENKQVVSEDVICKNFSMNDLDNVGEKTNGQIVKSTKNGKHNVIYFRQDKSAPSSSAGVHSEQNTTNRKQGGRSARRKELYVCENPELIYFDTTNYDTFIKTVLNRYSLIKYQRCDVKCDFDNFLVKTMKVGCSCNNKKFLKK
ncbi:putative phosphate acyltransferase [Trachipleistophora hominis]|uniref:Putative phosphate acyltransferase n=1 Tax=Trachipleistophora hominis TaxID=72359 RepID=L7JQW6_TRAHO|nr:putative phosphate acyltransferase [Trachipleistophora hominis]